MPPIGDDGGQVAAPVDDMTDRDAHEQLEREVGQMQASTGAMDVAGQEVATVLRAFAQVVESVRSDAEARAEQSVTEAQEAAREIREAAEHEARRMRTAAQDAHDQGLRGLEVARVEAKRVWEEARNRGDAILDDARSEAATVLEQARAQAAEIHATAEAKTARAVGEAQSAAAEIRRTADADVAALRSEAQRNYDDSTSELETARVEARRLVDDARRRADHFVNDAESRASSRVSAVFEGARAELQRLHAARVDALRAIDESENCVREISRSLRAMGDLDVNLFAAEVVESSAGTQAPALTSTSSPRAPANDDPRSQSAIVDGPAGASRTSGSTISGSTSAAGASSTGMSSIDVGANRSPISWTDGPSSNESSSLPPLSMTPPSPEAAATEGNDANEASDGSFDDGANPGSD
jgi:vacuolar-type H+-ATPase subunit H